MKRPTHSHGHLHYCRLSPNIVLFEEIRGPSTMLPQCDNKERNLPKIPIQSVLPHHYRYPLPMQARVSWIGCCWVHTRLGGICLWRSEQTRPEEDPRTQCVQRLDESLGCAVHVNYRILPRSSSFREPRYPLLEVIMFFSNSLSERINQGKWQLHSSSPHNSLPFAVICDNNNKLRGK